jgi:hypothetical protein
MESLLTTLGVVNDNATDLLHEVEAQVEEAEKTSTLTRKPKNNSNKITLSSILNNANSAQDGQNSAHNVLARREAYIRPPKIQFITDSNMVPKTDRHETLSYRKRKGYVNSSASLNIGDGDDQYEFASATKVNFDALYDLVKEAKSEKANHTADDSSKNGHTNKHISNIHTLLRLVDEEEGQLNEQPPQPTSATAVPDYFSEEPPHFAGESRLSAGSMFSQQRHASVTSSASSSAGAVPQRAEQDPWYRRENSEGEATSSLFLSAQQEEEKEEQAQAQLGGQSFEGGGAIVCPICSRSLGAQTPAAVVQSHVERCMRNSSRRSNSRSSREGTEYSYFVDDSEGDEGSEERGAHQGDREDSDSSFGGRGRRMNGRRGKAASGGALAKGVTGAGAGAGIRQDTGSRSGTRAASRSRNRDGSGSVGTSSSSSSASASASALTARMKKDRRVATRTSQEAAFEEDSDGDELRPHRSASAESRASSAEADSESDRESSIGRGAAGGAGFDVSIVDDWEDDAYAARLAGYFEGAARARRHATAAASSAAEPQTKRRRGQGQERGRRDGDEEQVDAFDFVETEYGTQVLRGTWDKLYQYQRDGCKWLFGLYEEGVGGILGDEMGMF